MFKMTLEIQILKDGRVWLISNKHFLPGEMIFEKQREIFDVYTIERIASVGDSKITYFAYKLKVKNRLSNYL